MRTRVGDQPSPVRRSRQVRPSSSRRCTLAAGPTTACAQSAGARPESMPQPPAPPAHRRGRRRGAAAVRLLKNGLVGVDRDLRERLTQRRIEADHVPRSSRTQRIVMNGLPAVTDGKTALHLETRPASRCTGGTCAVWSGRACHTASERHDDQGRPNPETIGWQKRSITSRSAELSGTSPAPLAHAIGFLAPVEGRTSPMCAAISGSGRIL